MMAAWPGIADGAVVEIAHLARQRLAQRAETAGGVERLVQNAVERELLELLERLSLAQLTVDDGLAGLAILVDDPVGAPGEVVIEGIGGEFRQGADAHAHVLQLVETRGQIAGHDGDEARREAALGNERGAGARRQLLDGAGAGDVLGQVEIVGAGGLGRFGDQAGGVVRRRAQHRELALEDSFAARRPG